MTDRREAIMANAKYLREVRPIDPEEITEYVEGRPHPAVVRQVLRESALELGLVEREDGAFEPVTDDPIEPRGELIERFPPAYERRLDEFLTGRYGPNWHEGSSGHLLRSAIRRFKSRYLRGQPVEYDDDVAAGYAIYHVPAYYASIRYVLDDLASDGLLGRRLRILDVGAGSGGPALGIFDTVPSDALLEYHAIEPSASADVLEAMLEASGPNVHQTIHREPVEALTLSDLPERGDSFDLVVLCNVLSELEEPGRVLRSLYDVLATDGSLVVTAPAEERTSTHLRRRERELETEVGATVYGPTVRLWPGDTPSDRGWSFDVRPDLATPDVQRRLDRAATDEDHETGEFRNVDVQFSYSIIRRNGRRRFDVSLDPTRFAKMAEMDRHVTNRIDLVAAKLSRSLSDTRAGRADASGGTSGVRNENGGGSRDRGGFGGAQSRDNPLFKVSDGSETVEHYAVLTRETRLNRTLLEADYGDLCRFENVLVLWNDDEDAYNLVVDDETVVDAVV